MKTLNENQNWSNGPLAQLQKNNSDPRPKIGDDDGISNRAMNILIVLLMLLTVSVSVVSATANDNVKYRILLRQAMLDIDRMHYDKAIVKLQEVRANTEESANVNYLLGRCYLYGEISVEKAAFYLNRATSNVSADYEDWDLDETRAPMETIYMLAKAHEELEQFGVAAEFYAMFLSDLIDKGQLNETSKTYAMINRRAVDCKIAASQVKSDESVFDVVHQSDSK